MTPEDFVKGCTLIGLTAEIVTTGSPEWKRVRIYQQGGEYAARCKEDRNFVGLYVGRASFKNDEFYSMKLFIGSGYYEHHALHLMRDKGKILNHINLYALQQRAHNEAWAQVMPKKEKEFKSFRRERARRLQIEMHQRYYAE